MSAQFHTPSFGDEEFDLSDCGADLGLSSGVGAPHGGVSIGNGGVYMPHEHQQTRRVRGMDHPMDGTYQGAIVHEDVYNNGVAQPAHQQQQQQHFIACQGNVSGVAGGAHQTAGMPTTVAARKQLTTPAMAHNNNNSLNTTAQNANIVPDPNEPAKPLSAYALFFRDTVSAIKQENPECSFQELSRIVASMWETLDGNDKDVYNRKNELARGEYIKQMRTYRQQQLDQQQELVHTKPAVFTIQNSRPNAANATDGGNVVNNYAPSGGMQATSPTATHPQQQYQQQHVSPQQQFSNITTPAQQQMFHNNTQPQQHVTNNQNSVMSTTAPQQHSGNMLSTTAAMATAENGTTTTMAAPQTANDPNAPQQIQMLTEAGAVQKCTRENCNKRAIINPDWEDEYCSNECVVLHCRNVFNSWVKSNLEARQQ